MSGVVEDLEWAAGQTLLSITLDFASSAARLQLEEECVSLEEVRSATLAAPWDGTACKVEYLRIVDRSAGELCVELRVRYSEVPRTYRIVCGQLHRRAT